MKFSSHLTQHSYSKIDQFFNGFWQSLAWTTTLQLNSIRVSGKFYKLFEIYLSNRFERVVLNAESLLLRPILTDIPQGSILGQILFLIYVNNMPNGLKAT